MSTRRYSLIVALGLCVAAAPACTKTCPPTEPQPPTVVVEPSPSAAPTAAAVSTSAPSAAPSPGWEGAWTSPSCGKRQYERRLNIAADHTFTAEDRVSPCPPDVQCIWSGIVLRAGTWSADGNTLSLTVASAATGAGAELPTTLLWDASSSAPAEPNDGAPCGYASAR